MHFIYKVTNIVNGKIYIGQSVDPTSRWRAHRRDAATPKVPFHHAIKKYGAHNFEFEIIAECETQDDANRLETEFVHKYESHVSTNKGYNATWGGMNAPKTEEWKAHMSEIMTGRPAPWAIGNTYAAGNTNWLGKPRSEETKQKISEALSGENHPNFGKTLPEETREKMSLAAMGENNSQYGKPLSPERREQISERLTGHQVSAETRVKIANGNRGKKMSDESRSKMSAAKKGKPSPHKGEKRTDEQKKRMSDSHKGKPSSWKGKKHTEEAKEKNRQAHLGRTWKLVDGVRVWSKKENA